MSLLLGIRLCARCWRCKDKYEEISEFRADYKGKWILFCPHIVSALKGFLPDGNILPPEILSSHHFRDVNLFRFSSWPLFLSILCQLLFYQILNAEHLALGPEPLFLLYLHSFPWITSFTPTTSSLTWQLQFCVYSSYLSSKSLIACWILPLVFLQTFQI